MQENHAPESRRELAHPRLVLVWLVTVTVAALMPALNRIVGHFVR